MGTVSLLLAGFVFAYLSYRIIQEKLVFLIHSNLKYKILDFLADFIYYGKDIGVEASLQLDKPSPALFGRRLDGQKYLESKLGSSLEETHGAKLGPKIVDCRFALHKVLMPLLRELEFPSSNRNFVTSLDAKKGIHKVQLENGEVIPYLGNDAVHTLGYNSFYKPLQDEIAKRMASPQATLKFAPIALNPELEKNADMILEMTGMDQVRYSLSGSEAVDCAIKDIKASCRGKQVVIRFQSAYHGHVSGVDFLNCQNHIFLKEGDMKSLELIEKYHFRIAAVIVNPMQHFTGINKVSPAGEKLNMGKRVRTSISKNDYAKWLHALQEKCNYCTQYLTKIAFVIDDIYFAFRTPELFSSKYFTHPDTGEPLQPDVMVLGKGVAAGYPLSMVLGRQGFLLSYDKKYLLQVNKSVGTLSAWCGGIIASNAFLEAMTGKLKNVVRMDPIEELGKMITKFDNFSCNLNNKFETRNIPLRIRNFSNTFSINYLENSVYNSRFPQYVIAEGVFLGNYSTGKWNMNADATEADLENLSDKFVAAAERMKEHGYFEKGSRPQAIIMTVQLTRFTFNYVKIFYDQIMEDKRIDIEVSHNHPVNKFGHFWSSVMMLAIAYPYLFMGKALKCCLVFLLSHAIRQSGHFFYEHQDRDIEKLKFGHKDGSKKEAVAGLLVAWLGYYYRAELWEILEKYHLALQLSGAQYATLVAFLTIVPHFVEIVHAYGWLRGISWQLKIWTDPITDLIDFYEYAFIHPKWFLVLKDQHADYKLDPITKAVYKVDKRDPTHLTSTKLEGIRT